MKGTRSIYNRVRGQVEKVGLLCVGTCGIIGGIINYYWGLFREGNVCEVNKGWMSGTIWPPVVVWCMCMCGPTPLKCPERYWLS